MSERYVVIGAGQAGANAALAMRQAGFSGSLVLVGDEPSLPYERPPLSKEMQTAIDLPAPALVQSAEQYRDLGIELRSGVKAEAIDPETRTVRLGDGSKLVFDRLLIATGGRSRRLPIPGGEHVRYLRTLEDAISLRTSLQSAPRVVCIGAGVIGLEFAASARSKGAAVTVLEAGGRAMERCVPSMLSTSIEALHRGRRVDLVFDAAVSSILAAPDGSFEVHTRDHVFHADLVVAGIGLHRDLTLALDAGLHTDGGILVDEFCETSVPGIFAAGDVACFYHPRYGRRMLLENWRHAQNHGIAAGRAMVDLREAYVDVPYFWTDQYDMHLQVAGFAHEAASTVVRGSVADRDFVAFHLDNAGRLIAASAANRPRDFRAASKLIDAGATIDLNKVQDSAIPVLKLAAA